MGGRCWLPDNPGLTSLATAARADRVVLRDHVSRLPCGVDVVVAPAARQASTIAVGLLAEAGLGTWLGDGTVVVDVGRLDPGIPSSEFVGAADLLVVVSHGDEASLLRLSDAGLPREKARLVIAGDCTFSSDEITRAVAVPVAAVLPWDPRAAGVVGGLAAPGRTWTKRGLPAAVRALAESLGIGTVQAVGALPEHAPSVSAQSRQRSRQSAWRADGAPAAARPESPSTPEVRT
jgi:hypothetical protein